MVVTNNRINYRIILRKRVLITFLLITSLVMIGKAQMSHGGFPLDIPQMKSSKRAVSFIQMPSFKLQEEINSTDSINEMKSLKFAHSFPVSINTKNSGLWYNVGDYRVWQVAIESKGALSLNLVFQKFHLPPGARLFLFDEKKEFVLGAFTSQNNKAWGKLGVNPLSGDQIVVQYEEPLDAEFEGELEIGEVNHDYKGIIDILQGLTRRTSGSCNVNVNCETESNLDLEKRSVVRILAGDELGSGTLLNNSLEDGKPYIISAMHVYDDPGGAQTAVFTFNYESAFCTDLDGSLVQSISGSSAVAWFDSLDMLFVELSEIPPANYRAYWAGWDARTVNPMNSYCIHHPNGDTKKISHDTGKCDSIRYSDDYINYGSWRIGNWEMGTTEEGSSGAGLFSSSGSFIGVLQGGAASCTNISYDLFTRFDKLFDYRKEYLKQLKHWLDPLNTGNEVLSGFDYYVPSNDECVSVSNFLLEDEHVVLTEESGNYYSGNNTMNITEVAEKFTTIDSGVLTGISIGISKMVWKSTSPELLIRIYKGEEKPEFLQKQFSFSFEDLQANSMNYLRFDNPVGVDGNFFISFVLPSYKDTLTFFQSEQRKVLYDNSIYYLKSGDWKSSEELFGFSHANAALLVEAIVCGAEIPKDTLNVGDKFAKVYPVPASDYLIVQFTDRINSCDLKLVDLSGRIVMSKHLEDKAFDVFDISVLNRGVYILHLFNGEKYQNQKILMKGK